MRLLPLLIMAGMSLGMGACAIYTPQVDLTKAAPQQWYAPLPHNGTLTNLSQWWDQLGDPLLVRLIASAQNARPTLAAARTRIEQAHVTRVSTGAASRAA